jgi:uncharacterized protein YqeY
MSLEEKVMQLMKEAMKAKDEALLRSVRAIKAEIIKAKTEPGANGVITEDGEMKLLQKMVKQRKDSLSIFQQQNREDLAKKEMEEIEILEKFLPAQLSQAELETAIAAIIISVGAVSIQDLGKVMGSASKQLAGKADGKAIAEAVKALLNK